MADQEMYIEIREEAGSCTFHGYVSKEVGTALKDLLEQSIPIVELTDEFLRDAADVGSILLSKTQTHDTLLLKVRRVTRV